MKDKEVKCRVSAEMREQIEKIAITRDIPISQVVREAIKEYIQEERDGTRSIHRDGLADD
jgi:predicted DNA-binding protein